MSMVHPMASSEDPSFVFPIQQEHHFQTPASNSKPKPWLSQDFGTDRVKFITSGVEIELFRVKRPGERFDSTNPLHQKVTQARFSYQMWGDVPLIDRDDERSFIYLAKTTYPTEIGQEEEWISVRLITQQDGYGQDVTHLAYYSDQGEKIQLAKVLEDKGILPHHLVVVSRVCKIPPRNQTRNKFIAQSFAALRLMMKHDAELVVKAQYVVLRHHKQLQKLLSTPVTKVRFRTAERTFGIVDGRVGIDRDLIEARNYVLQYPGYFFKSKDLRRLLVKEVGRQFEINGVKVEEMNHKNAKHFIPLWQNEDELAKRLRYKIFNLVPDGMRLSALKVTDLKKQVSVILDQL